MVHHPPWLLLRLVSAEGEWATQGGDFTTQGVVELSEAILPQFKRRRKFSFKAHKIVFDSKSMYDIIVGRDILQQIGMDILYSSKKFCWDKIKVLMTPCGYWTKYDETDKTEEAFLLDAKYGKVELEIVVEEQTHLNKENIKLLLELLQKFEGIFQGTLGKYTGDKVNIELKENIKPFQDLLYSTCNSNCIKKRSRTVREDWGSIKKKQLQMGSAIFCNSKERHLHF